MTMMLCILVIGLPTGSVMAKTTVRIAHRWGVDSHFAWGFDAAARGFEKRNSEIEVEIPYGYNDDKYIIEILGGTPPDIVLVYPPALVSWGVRGLLQPLDEFARRSNVTSSDFVPAAWPQHVWAGKLYAMPLQVDPNFALIWNKQLFAEGGLMPEQGPETLTDFEAYFKKLTRVDADGRMSQIGMVPWDVYGGANTVFTWGWIYGGSFYDYESNQVTAHDGPIVEALTYLRSFYERYNPELPILSEGLPPNRGRFAAGRDAMRFSVTGELFEYLERFPDLDIGIGKMFYQPESGVHNPAWLGGWSLGMPPGVRDPQVAWELMSYLTADREGTACFAEASGWMPFYVKSPVYQSKFARDPYWRVYMDIALTAESYRPAMPVIESYYNELDKAFPLMMSGEMQPRDALQQVSERVQLELDKVLQGKD